MPSPQALRVSRQNPPTGRRQVFCLVPGVACIIAPGKLPACRARGAHSSAEAEPEEAACVFVRVLLVLDRESVASDVPVSECAWPANVSGDSRQTRLSALH